MGEEEVERGVRRRPRWNNDSDRDDTYIVVTVHTLEDNPF